VAGGKQPRVLIDATAVPADRGGVGRYVDYLITSLDDLGANFAVVCQRSDHERFGRMAPTASVIAGPASISHRPARLSWEQTGLPIVAEKVGADVIHSPHYTMPLRGDRPVVVTLHDVTFFTDPDVHSSVKGVFFRSATRTALTRATRIVVPSQATRTELRRLLEADVDRMDVIPHGVDTNTFHPPTQMERDVIRQRLGLPEEPGYIAFLGTLEPRKNVPALIEAWVRVAADREDPPALVIAGSSGWDEEVDRAMANVPSHLRILRPGYLHFADLPAYLGGALFVAYPSRGEGFGLPVLEAMACGAPVMTTSLLSLPEVGGDAVYYTGIDADSLADGLATLLDNAELRATLGEKGIARAKEFTWDSSARLHLETYERAYQTASAAV